LFDFAVVLDRSPDSIRQILPVIRAKRAALTGRIDTHRRALEEEFEAIAALERTFETD
jgi:hypothetical protein